MDLTRQSSVPELKNGTRQTLRNDGEFAPGIDDTEFGQRIQPLRGENLQNVGIADPISLPRQSQRAFRCHLSTSLALD